MVYRTEEQASVLRGRSVLEVALDLHMAVSGSADSSHEQIEEDANLLEEVLSDWNPSVHHKMFDDAVALVLMAALSEFREDKARSSNG